MILGQDEQPPGPANSVRFAIGNASAQRMADPVEHVFGKLLRVVEQLFHFPCHVRQLPPAAHPGKLVGVGFTFDEDVFQTEGFHRVGLQGFERHMFEEIT